MNYQLLALLMISWLAPDAGLVEPFSSTGTKLTGGGGGELVEEPFDAVEAADAGRDGGRGGEGDAITPQLPAPPLTSDGESSGDLSSTSSSSSSSGSDGSRFRLGFALIDRLAATGMAVDGGGGGGGGGDCNICSTESSSGLRRRHFFSGFMMTSDFCGKLFRRSIFSITIWLLLPLEANERGEGGVDEGADPLGTAFTLARSCWCWICKDSEVAILMRDRFSCCCRWCT